MWNHKLWVQNVIFKVLRSVTLKSLLLCPSVGSSCVLLKAERVKKIWQLGGKPASRWGRNWLPVARGRRLTCPGLSGIGGDYSPLSLSLSAARWMRSAAATLRGGFSLRTYIFLHLYWCWNLQEPEDTSLWDSWGFRQEGEMHFFFKGGSDLEGRSEGSSSSSSFNYRNLLRSYSLHVFHLSQAFPNVVLMI